MSLIFGVRNARPVRSGCAAGLRAESTPAIDILDHFEADRYSTRFGLVRDIEMYLFWINHYSLTMFEKCPRGQDVPRRREAVFLRVVSPGTTASESRSDRGGVQGATSRVR